MGPPPQVQYSRELCHSSELGRSAAGIVKGSVSVERVSASAEDNEFDARVTGRATDLAARLDLDNAITLLGSNLC